MYLTIEDADREHPTLGEDGQNCSPMLVHIGTLSYLCVIMQDEQFQETKVKAVAAVSSLKVSEGIEEKILFYEFYEILKGSN